jgi:hypothetical protein
MEYLLREYGGVVGCWTNAGLLQVGGIHIHIAGCAVR